VRKKQLVVGKAKVEAAASQMQHVSVRVCLFDDDPNDLILACVKACEMEVGKAEVEAAELLFGAIKCSCLFLLAEATGCVTQV
jgi:hypothetical protein